MGLHSISSNSTSTLTGMDNVAVSRTWSDILLNSGSGAMIDIAADSGSTSDVGSGIGSMQHVGAAGWARDPEWGW